MSSGLEYDTDLMIGEPVDSHPAKEPFRTILKGRVVSLIFVDPDVHSRDLFDNLCGSGRDRLWLYKEEGPFHEIEPFHKWITEISQIKDPFHFAIIDNKTNVAHGLTAYIRIEPEHRVIEVRYHYY